MSTSLSNSLPNNLLVTLLDAARMVATTRSRRSRGGQTDMPPEDKTASELHEARQKIEELTAKLSNLEAEKEISKAREKSLTKYTTARLTILQRRFSDSLDPTTPQDTALSKGFQDIQSLETLTRADLDIVMSSEKAVSFLQSFKGTRLETELLSSLCIQTCQGECKQPKLHFESTNFNFQSIDEFPRSGKLRCCEKWVCLECSVRKREESISWDWIYDAQKLGSWIKCVGGCGNCPPLGRGDLDLQDYRKRYERANLLRTSLKNIDPPLSFEESSLSVMFYKSLQGQGYMCDFFEDSRIQLEYDEMGRQLPLNAGPMEVITANGVRVPFFKKFLNREALPRICSVCEEGFLEFVLPISKGTSPSGDHWSVWLDTLRNFPCKSTLQCESDLTSICYECMRIYVATKIEELGRNVIDRLLCPTCDNHVLKYERIQHFCSAETRARLENYVLLDYLSKQPDFRWCLSSNCSNGEIYVSDHDEPRITCSECKFEMCFIHQVPYHHNVSCAEFDRQLLKDKPLDNSAIKKCPGCDISIVKDSGCWHMRCSQCHHEFCWECLADWKRIDPMLGDLDQDMEEDVDPEELLRVGHNPGCFFATSYATPVGLDGDNLRQALGDNTGDYDDDDDDDDDEEDDSDEDEDMISLQEKESDSKTLSVSQAAVNPEIIPTWTFADLNTQNVEDLDDERYSPPP